MKKGKLLITASVVAVIMLVLAIAIVATVSNQKVFSILQDIISGSTDNIAENDLNGDGVVNVLDAILALKTPDTVVPQRESLIYNKDGSFGGSLSVEKYGEGAPLNGKYDVTNSDYYTVNNDWYNMTSTEERIIFPKFKSYQQTMQDTSGIACIMMMLNYLGEDVINQYTELELLKLYEEVNETTVYGNGTTEAGLIKLIEALDLGYTTDNTSIDFVTAGNTNLATLYGATKSMCVDSIKEGKFVLVRYQSPNGYGWKLVAGYDTLGKVKSNVTGEESDTFGHEVIIFADPNDGFDHLQDGFNTERAMDFIVWFRNLDFNTGTQHDKYSYIIIDPNLDIEFDYKPVDTTVKQTLYDVHLPLNPDGTYGGTRDSALYGNISSGNGWWNQTHTNYYKINDFYNMGSEGSRILLPNYTVLQQTMASSCGICAVNSAMKYFGYDESYYDLELSYLNVYEGITGTSIKGSGTSVTTHSEALEQLGYRSISNYTDRYDTPEFPTYESYVTFMSSHLSSGRPIMVSTMLGSGHYLTVIGYDDMGTDYIYDDVIICADSCDYWDSYQDGYNIYSAYKFYTQHSNSKLNKFHSYVVVFDNNIEQDSAYSVAETLEKAKTGELKDLNVLVEGLFAGVSDEGSGAPQEIILKDVESDKLIAVQNVTYGKFPDYGYQKGDKIQLWGTVVCENFTDNGQNKIYLEFADNNPASVADTIISRNNEMNYTFDGVTQVSSWTEMKNFFKADTLEPYTYVRLTGDFWCNSYAKTGDAVNLYRLTMNGSATSAAKMAPDGTRTVAFRRSMMDANVPTALTAYFEKIVMNASSPGGLANKDDLKDNLDFYAVVTTVNSAYFYITILDSDWLMGSDKTIEIKNNQDIVKEVAYAYFRQGTQLLYDQNKFRSENWSPEQATKQQIFYTDCSSFVNNVYHEAFGVNILGVPLTEKSCNTANYTDYAKANVGTNADVIGYWMATDYTTAEEEAAVLQEIYGLLQPGDIITYRHGKSEETAGHSMLYMGDGLLLHSTGKSEVPNSANPDADVNKDRCDFNEKIQGSVQRLYAYELFENTSSSRYLMKKTTSDTVRSISILRPLANGLTPTEKTQNRIQIPGINVDKTILPGLSVSVVPGGEITYVASIQNHSANTYTDVVFEDILSDNLTFVSSNKNLTVNGQKVSMKFNIGPLETVEIRWTAKVKEDAPVGSLIESKNTTVGGMTVFETVNTVGSITNEKLNAVAEKAREYATNGTTFSDPLDLAKAIYKDVFGVDVFGVDSAADIFNNLFIENGTVFALNTQGALAEMVVPRLYNCTKISSYDDVVPIYFENNFMPGDLIFCNWGENYRLFVYLGNGELVAVDNTATAATLVENGLEGHKFVSGSTHVYRLDTVLAKVRTYEKAVVLRPSISSTVYNAIDDTFSVAEVLSGTSDGELAGKLVLVEGLFAGVSDEGSSAPQEIILKDLESDKLIAVQNVTYGKFPDYGYEKGDKVQLWGTVVSENFTDNGQNKIYLEFSDNNPASVADTIISRNNEMNYTFEGVTQVSSWTEMKNFFKADTMEPYTYVRLTGDFWSNSYANQGDAVNVYRLTMNGSASSVAKMAPDGARTVAFRRSMMDANVPTALTSYFEKIVMNNGTSPAGLPNKEDLKDNLDFYAVVTTVNSSYFYITVLDSDWLMGSDKIIEIEDDGFDIVEEVAYAYFRQGTQLLYDQNRYRSENWSPEQATKQQIFYTDCSSFVNNVYYEAFGVNILGVPLTEKSCSTANYTAYAKENVGKKADVIGYWVATDYTTDEEKAAALKEIYDSLQPGDILTYRHGKTSEAAGHSMLYMGDGIFLHSTGKSDKPNSTTPTATANKDYCNLNEKIQGSVQIGFAYDSFENKDSSRYLMKNDDEDVMRSISIIRPLANGLTPTEKTVNRMKIAGINVDKTILPGLSVSVVPGGEITYVASIQNHSANTYTDVVFEDILSDNLTFVSSNKNLTVNGQKVSLKFNIGPLETVEIRWTAKVKENTPVGSLIESKNTTVGGMKIFETVNTVGAFTNEQLNAVADKAREYATNATTFSNPITLASYIYKEALGIDIFGVGSAAAIFDNLFVENGTIFALNKQGALAEMVVPRLYNCTKISSYDDVVPIYFEHNFMPGDLIFCNWGENYRLYVYLGNGELVAVDNTATAATLVENGLEAHKYVSSNVYRLDSVLSKVRTYEKAVVLRPSIAPSLFNPVEDTFSVSEVLSGTSDGELAGKLVYVEGLFAGVSDEGAGYNKELILKDTSSDKLIAVQGVTYGTYPEYGYEKGDLVRLCARVVERNFSDGKRENKIFLQFDGSNNPTAVNETIVSSGNQITYAFDNVTVIDSWDDMKAFFDPNTLEAYSYVRISGEMWFNSYSKAADKVPIHRFHMNSSASSLATMKPDGVRALGLRQNALNFNAPQAMETYFKNVVGNTTYPGTKCNLDFYAVVTSTNSVNYQLTILENDWLLDVEAADQN